MTSLLPESPPKPLPYPRTTASIGAELRSLHAAGDLDLPLPGGSGTAARWAALAAFGRRDLALARLAEGHADAVAILAEAGRSPVPGALYGVWAAKSGGTGAALEDGVLTGTVRFCSGLSLLDRALVAAGDRLVEADLADPGVRRHPDAWQAVGMDASDSGDVVFDGVRADLVGPPGWYVTRPGFALGGAGVAAVWLGGAAGVFDGVLAYLRDRGGADEHQLAHVGAIHTALTAADAVLSRAAGGPVDALLAGTCRAVTERTAVEVLERALKVTGPTPACRDRRFAQRVADLPVYVRQHHAERDLAALGRDVLGTP
ncbi:alkylation response protein AidB-like acyl-CoA dehydrogenase [Amycolatopsis lexingtonensis]|uniref:Alkylation response protein AidB-like acyl-CoA dehydrogenase n=1 Tax=Amycolatopsis lexingtonensis TaxID=218822 RepID=A0ABR9HUM3_9PSEU|nr:acyl-CoA dehydrogenase family protein [Amycolatopsis lexingtonensis]MBE1494620.1 alkylation response protein AidB-like acyl-CoA dehydrogenase [Amycolatopsis lexingtonensis]